MSFYLYKARDNEGKIYERTVEAKDRLSLYGIIRDEGGTVFSIKEVKGVSKFFSFEMPFGGIKTQQKITFAKNLGLMIEAGLPVTRALAVMEKQSKNRSFKKLLGEMEQDLRRGKTLSESLGRRSKVFSELFVSMVRAGEESGNVSSSLATVSNQMEKTHLLVKKVRGALIYPGVVISVMIVLAILLLVFMVPTLTETFKGIGAELPLSTRIIISASDFLIANVYLAGGALLLLVLSTVLFFRSVPGRKIIDVTVLKLPVIGEMVREFESARTARTLSSLLSAGVEIVVALGVTIDVMQNHLYKKALMKARAAVEKGESMSAVFAEYEYLYPVFISEMIAVGEETGKIAEMLKGAAGYYEEAVDQKTKDLSTIIEPVLMIIIGIGVGIFAVSMLAPTYSLVDYI